jgi:hypothetical protein
MSRWKPMGLIGPPRSETNTWASVGRSLHSHLVTADWVYAGNPIFDPVNVQAALGELDLLPLQVAHLGGPQTAN